MLITSTKAGQRKRVTREQEPVNVLSNAQGCTAT